MSCAQHSRVDAYVDDELGPEAVAAFEAHLVGCQACRAEVASTRALLSAARALPLEISPERDLWPELERGAAPWGARVVRFALERLSAGHLVGALALAALLLVWVGRRAEPSPAGVWPLAVVQPALPTPLAPLPAPFDEAEVRLAGAAAELGAAFALRQGELSPELGAELTRSLGLIDVALAQCRASLLSSGADPGAARLFVSTYGRKIALLQLALRLPADA